MIISKLSGGLGNQMFQYAFGLKMSALAKKGLKLDTSFFEQKHNAHTTPRSYQLGYFQLKNKVEVSKKIFLKNPKWMHLNEKLHNYLPNSFYTKFHEKNFRFDANNLMVRGNCIYSGYWQSHKYFDDILEELQQDFSLVENLSSKNDEYLSKIQNCNAVGLHIRRGDYITNQMAFNFHGICSMSYYDEAIKNIEELEKHPVFFIFTDDPDWARESFKIKHPMHLIEDNDPNPEIDLFLFSKCQYHIIANSSFSWWGAFLAGNRSKCVVRPSRWFLKEEIDTTDLCPSHWIAI